MAIDFRNVTDWTIPQGNVIRVYDSQARIIWQKETYTDMDYISCADAYTGIIVPVSIPTGSTYDIMVHAKVVERPTASSSRLYTIVMGGTNTSNSQKYGWGYQWQQYFYNGTKSYGPWNVEAVYWNGWSREISSNLFSSNNIATNTEVQMNLYNTSRTYQNYSAGYTNTYTTAANWNGSAAVNGWYGFGLLATGETTWDTSDNQRFIGNIYGAYIKVDDEYIYNFKPVRRDRDGVYGLYDTVNNTFYPSSTSNPFTHEVIVATNLYVYNTSVGLGKSTSIRRSFTPTNVTSGVLNWSIANPNIASISGNGLVTGLALGNTTVTATTTDGSNLTSTATLRVYTPATDVVLSDYNLVLEVGESATVTGTVYPSDADDKDIYYRESSSDISITTNGNACTITGEQVGFGVVTASCDGIEETINVRVVEEAHHVTGVSLNRNSITLEGGQTYKLTATITPSDADITSVKWSSSNTNVATVNSSGTVTAVGAGTCTITCTTDDRGYTDTCTVTVPTHRLTIVPTPNTATVEMTGYGAGQGTGYVDVICGTTISYEVSASGYATTNGSYTMGTSDHTINVTLTPGDVKVTNISLNTTSAQLYRYGGSVQLTATVSPSTASVKTVNWTSSNTSVATVDSNGLVSAAGAGTCTITCSATDGSGVKATCAITVFSISITPSEATIVSAGNTTQVRVNIYPTSASIVGHWQSSDSTIATISSSNNQTLTGSSGLTTTVTAVKNGTVDVTFISSSVFNIYPTCLIRVSVPITTKSVTIYNPTEYTAYYGFDNTTSSSLGPGESDPVDIEDGEVLYIARSGSNITITIDSCDSNYRVRASAYEFGYDDIVDGDLITLSSAV